MTIATLYSYFSGEYQILGVETSSIQKTYGFLIGSAFAGVVGTGFYPLMGNRMWCRFGCPLAGYIGIIQKFKSKFRITTNGGQCISCGNCSTYCEMGIDVRWYAQRGQNIVRSSCVGCGVCSAVCPRGVLKLENGSEIKRVNDNPILIGDKNIQVIHETF
jgi:polyferredoxin